MCSEENAIRDVRPRTRTVGPERRWLRFRRVFLWSLRIAGERETPWLGRILRAIGSWVARRADELVVVSPHLRRYLPERRAR